MSCQCETHGQVIKDKKSCHPVSGGQVIKDKKSCPPETGGQVQGRWIIFVDEPGFYELVFRSRLPAAKMFREWVFTKVLPSIRKYGYFKMFDNLQSRKIIINGKNTTNIQFYKLESKD